MAAVRLPEATGCREHYSAVEGHVCVQLRKHYRRGRTRHPGASLIVKKTCNTTLVLVDLLLLQRPPPHPSSPSTRRLFLGTYFVSRAPFYPTPTTPSSSVLGTKSSPRNTAVESRKAWSCCAKSTGSAGSLSLEVFLEFRCFYRKKDADPAFSLNPSLANIVPSQDSPVVTCTVLQQLFFSVSSGERRIAAGVEPIPLHRRHASGCWKTCGHVGAYRGGDRVASPPVRFFYFAPLPTAVAWFGCS